jgi:phage terminase large subunit-like protein
MAAVADQAPVVVRVCASCGVEFKDVRRSGAPRTYCDLCRPRRAGDQREQSPSSPRLRGKPFTLEHFKAWAKRLKLKGGEPFVLEAWQEVFVADVLEAIAARTPMECWLIVPEGNGKSTLVAVVVLYCVEFAEDARIPVASSTRDQAEIIFQQGSGFVRRTPCLRARIECKPGLREIVFDATSRAKIFASDASSGDGVIPYPIEVLDELHRHRDLELYRTWAGKLDKEQSVLIVISTAGEPGSDFEETREKMRVEAVEVERDGCFGRYVGHQSVLHEYAVPENGDVEDLELVAAANPSRRITVDTLGAKRARPSWSMPHWRRLTCNLPTRGEYAAISEREWEQQRIDNGIPAGASIWLGLDLGFKLDTTALVPFWWRDNEFRLFGKPTVIVPPGGGESTSPDLIEAALLEIHGRNPVELVVMDPHEGASIADWIRGELGAMVLERQQTLPLQAQDYSRFMDALRRRWLWHPGDPVFTRHVLNAVSRILPRGDAVFERPHRSRASALQDRRVVDALDAAAMVHSVAVGQYQADEKSSGWRGM